MPIIAPPNPESRQISSYVTELELRMKRVEVGLRAVQLGNSSLEGSGIGMFDANGNYRGTIGFQQDGTTTVTSQNPLPPPIPSAPSVSSGIACLIVKHTGETADGTGNPADFSHLRIYTADAGLPEVRTLRGTINPVPGEYVVTGLDYTNYLVDVTAVNLGGKESDHSVPTSGTPQMVVGSDIINGAITELNLAANSVTEAALQANAVTETKIADNSISTPKVIAGAINAGKIAADSIQSGHITSQSITSDKIVALTITANEIAANAITAGKIQAGAITASKLEANMVVATRIIAGTEGAARVEIHPTAGIQGFRVDGTTRTFWIDASTGNVTATGSFQTAFAGQRIQMNPNGVSPDTIRFYPSSGSAYASIDSITSGTNYAGVMMYGASAGTNRGIVIAREDYASIVYGNPSNLTAITTDIFAKSGGARVRSYKTEMMADQDQGSDPGFVFQMTNGVTPRSGTILYYNNSGFDEAHLAAINKDVGITFAGGKVYIVGNTVTQRRDFQANNIIYDGTLTQSGANYKRNVTPATDLDVRQGTKYAKAVRFQRTYLDQPPVYDQDGNLITPAQEAPVQLGLMAADLPTQVQATIENFTPGQGDSTLAIDNQALLTLCWQGIGEVWDDLTTFRNSPVTITEVTTAPPPPVSGATLFTMNGSLYVMFPSGKQLKVA